MSLAGDFVTARNSPNCTYENIIKWIQGHGGSCSREVTPETTHLIVTIEEYKKKTAQGMHQFIALTPSTTAANSHHS
jgi:hypothetical protein